MHADYRHSSSVHVHTHCNADTFFYSLFLFFFNDTATTEIYTLSLHDALPILQSSASRCKDMRRRRLRQRCGWHHDRRLRSDRKSTRLNSSHTVISYAVFCLKKKIEDNRN